MTTTASIIVQLAVIAIWFVLYVLRNRDPRMRKIYSHALPALALLALAAHVDFFRWHGRADRVHRFDFYVYYTSAKYFPEVGYKGLYEATTVADYQTHPDWYEPSVRVRSLEDYSLITKKDILPRQREIIGRFSADRWEEFKSDLEVFRGETPRQWSYGRVLGDHGYNATPTTMALHHALTNWLPLDAGTFVEWFSAADLALAIATAGIIGLWIGWEWGWLFLIFFAANPLNDHAFVGGSFLRYTHYYALALGLVAFTKARWITSGILFALAIHLRISPAVFVLALLASDLVGPDRVARLMSRRAFYGSVVATGLLLLAATAPIEQPGGEKAWLGFAHKMSTHGDNYAANRISVRAPFWYSGKPIKATTHAGLERRARRLLKNRKVLHTTLATALLGLSLVYARRARGEPQAMFVGLVWVYALLDPTHYEFMVLGLVPLMFIRDPRSVSLAGLGCGLILATRLVPTDATDVIEMDRAFAWMSAALGVYLTVAMLDGIRRGPSASSEITQEARTHQRIGAEESSS